MFARKLDTLLGFYMTLLLSLGSYDAAEAAVSCRAIFSRQESLFLENLELHGAAFFKTIPVHQYAIGSNLHKTIAVKKLGVDVTEDYRMYLPPENAHYKRYDENFAKKVEMASSKYKYLFSDYFNSNLIQGGSERYAHFRSFDGIEFIVADSIVRTHLGSQESLMVTLDHIAEIVRRGHQENSLRRLDQESIAANSRKEKSDFALVEDVPVESAVFLKRYRHLVVHRAERENIFVETVDTEIRQDKVPTQIQDSLKRNDLWDDAIEKRGSFGASNLAEIYGRKGKFVPERELEHAENDALKEGRSKQKDYLDEIMAFIFPLYAKRRGWSEEFIEQLYKKTFETADNTKYIVVREKLPDGTPGKIIGAIGITKADYGKVKFFDTNLGWVEVTGRSGSSAMEDNHVISGRQYSPMLWGGSVGALPGEKYLDIQLPRPAISEHVERPVSGFLPVGANYSYDPAKGASFSTGRIYEPVRFGLAKSKTLRGVTYSEILLELFSTVFASDRSPEFNLNGQRLYTYNDDSGMSLYRPMGFKPIPGVPKINKDGSDWTALELSPATIMEKILDPKLLHDRNLDEFANQFAAMVNQAAKEKP